MQKRRIFIALVVLSLIFSSPKLWAAASQEGPKSQQQVFSTEDKSQPAEQGFSLKKEQLSTSDAKSSPAALYEDRAFQSVERLDVDPATGTATVGIPISVPLGRAGIQPSIALAYNSSFSNGLMGMGWSLEFGKISRSTKYGMPTYTNTDCFVLTHSGSRQELVDVSGNATLFRPEIDDAFMKIEFVNGSYWRVTDKKGIGYYFGQTAASQIVDPSNSANVFEWYLDKVEDMYGNDMSLTYIKDQNQIYPYQIHYTGNTPGNLLPFATIEFETESRPDTMFSYLTRFLIRTEKRISAVKVFAQGVLQRKYQLVYSQSPMTQRSLLSQVIQYGADGVSSLPATTFTYQQGDKGFQVASGWNIPANAKFAEYQQGNRYADLGVRIADVNSDGYPDLLRYHQYSNGTTIRETFLHNKNQGWEASSAEWKFPASLANFLLTAPEIDKAFGLCLADVNGDGWVDLFRHFQDHPANAGGVITNQAFINNHVNGWDLDASWQLPEEGVLPINWVVSQSGYFYHEYTGNIIDDVNGDGFADYVKSKKEGFGPQAHMTFINKKPLAGGWTYNSAWNTQDSIYTDFAHGAILADLNGDNLKDIMYSKEGIIKVFINNGATWYEDDSSPWKNEFGYTNFSDGSTQCADINGDGLVDLIVSSDASEKALLNNGQGWVLDYAWVVPGNLKSNGTKLLDADADGMLDVVKHFNGTTPEVYLSRGKVPDLLVEMNNGMGGARVISYDSACHYNNDFFPFAAQVVQSLTLSSGDGDSYTTYYTYGHGLWSASKRESRGFGYVKVMEAEGNYSETYMHQDDIYKGKIDRQEHYDGSGNLFSKAVYQWNHQQLDPSVFFVYLEQVDQFVYDGNTTGVRTQEKYFYEESPQYGNATKTVQLGRVDLTTGEDMGVDSRTVEAAYHNNVESGHWFIGIPKQVIVKDDGGTQVRKSWFYYDGSNDINALPVKGALTKKQFWAGNDPGAVDPVTEYTYDPYGNLLTTKDPNNSVSMITYDTEYLLFPLEVKNVKDHVIVKDYYGVNGIPLDSGDGYRGLWGQIKSVKDQNNQKGNRTYDTFGRLVATVSPLDSLAYPTTSLEYEFLATGTKIVTHQREVHNNPSTIDSISFYDGLGRFRETKTKSGYLGQFVVSGQVEYNSRGLPQKKYASYFTTFPFHFADPIDQTVAHTTSVYDAMGRVVQTINPDGSYVTIVYDDMQTTTIDENGHKQVSFVDAYGRFIQMQEYVGADGRSSYYPSAPYSLYAETYYSYDSEGNLTQVQDAQGNVTSIVYDSLGRKTSMDDPDMGLWQYKYDPAGNLVWQKDALGREIVFSYDEINRLIRKDNNELLSVDYFYDGTSMGAQDIFFNDDGIASFSSTSDQAINGGLAIDGLRSNPPTPMSRNYGVGRLTKASYDASGQTRFVYDLLGREKSSIKQIDGINYQINRSYDAADRVTKVMYPDQSKILYAYNSAGQIDGIGSPGTNGFSDIKEDPATFKKINDLALRDQKNIYRKPVVISSHVPSFAQLLTQKREGEPKGRLNGDVSLSPVPLQPLQGIRQDYTISFTWSGATNGTYKLYTILLESDTGMYLSGAHDWGSTPPGPWTADNIDITTSSGSTTLVKDLEAYSTLLGYPIHHFIWLVELRRLIPGVTYNQDDPSTFYLDDSMHIHTTASVDPMLGLSVNPENPHPAVLAKYDFSLSWTNLPTNLGYDYRLFYTLLENMTGNYYTAAQDPLTGTSWAGGDVNMPDTLAFGNITASKELIAFSSAWGAPITSYLWVAQIRRVVSGQVYDPANPDTYVPVMEKIIPAQPGEGLDLSMSVNYYRPLVNAPKQHQISFSWTDAIPSFNDQIYDYKYYITILDADSNYLAATTTNGQWWTEMGNITQASPNTISITKDLTVHNNDGTAANTDRFIWIGEIRRYPQSSPATYTILSSIVETVGSKNFGSSIYVNNVLYNAQGQVVEIEYGNNAKTNYTYDPNNLRLMHLVTINAQNQFIQDLSYGYDEAGNLLSIVDGVNTATQSFQYDALNRLVQAQGSYGTKIFQYDQVGNILLKDGLTFTYGENGAGPHALTSLSDGTTFQYDSNGNMKRKIDPNGMPWDYIYDGENRLVEVKKKNVTQEKYGYDGDGGRIKKIAYEDGLAIIDHPLIDSEVFDVSKFARRKNRIDSKEGYRKAVVTKYVGSLYEVQKGAAICYV